MAKKTIKDLSIELNELKTNFEDLKVKYEDLTRKCDNLEKNVKDQLNKQVVLKCIECDYECGSENDLKNHKIFNHVKKGPFKCKICELQFVEKWKYEGHIKTCEQCSCDQCDFFLNQIIS